MSVLVIAEHDGATLVPATLNTVTAATRIDADVHLLVAGSGCAALAEQAAKIEGVVKVRHADAPAYEQASAGPAPSIFDAPPLLTHPESRVLLEHVDGVVLVVRARSSRRADVASVKQILDDAGVPVFGSILNRYKSDMPFGMD